MAAVVEFARRNLRDNNGGPFASGILRDLALAAFRDSVASRSKVYNARQGSRLVR
jgi:hypothetical protein